MSAENPNYPEYYFPNKAETLRDQLEFRHMGEQPEVIDGSAFTLYDPGDIGLPRTGYHAVVGEFRMGTDDNVEMVVVRERRYGDDTYQVLGLSKDKEGKSHINGYKVTLEQGKEITIGREHDATQLWDEADPEISRKHLKISLFGDRIYAQDISSNGTKAAGVVTGKTEPQHETNEHIAFHTESAHELMLKLNSRSEIMTRNGETYVDGRVTVGRDTIINADRPAIDIRSWQAGGESIVVDSKKYPEEFEELKSHYEKKLKQLGGRFRKKSEEMKLRAIFETVRETMEYDLNFVEDEERKVQRLAKDGMRKIGLNKYLREGKGVCRHMALAVAWLGGELTQQGELDGMTTAGVNQRKSDNAAHEWARYTAADGTVYIIDPAQKKFGKLADFLDDKETWEYFRPGERSKYDALRGKGEVDPANIVFGAGQIVRRMYK
jgi:hypothetical protein